MNLLTEHSPASLQPWSVQTLSVLALSMQRFPARWRRCLAGLQRAATWALRVAFALTVAGLITACAPGTGGTGVGPVAGTYVSLNTSVGSSAVAGTAPSSIASANYVLVLEPLAIRLTGACLAFQFDGAWAEANGEIRVTGSYRQALPVDDLALALAPALPGTLVARVQSTGLAVTLQDARGAVVLSFTTDAKVADGAAVVSAPACNSLAAGPVP